MEIYNRDGGLVYSNPNYRNDWGATTSDGKNMPVGAYFCFITSADGQTFRKSLTIPK